MQNIQEIKAVIQSKVVDRVVPEHTETEHFYRSKKTDEVYHSVTTKSGILEAEYLKKWASKLAVEHIDKNWDKIKESDIARQEVFDEAVAIHQAQFKEAGKIGTEGHKVVEDYLLRWMTVGYRPESIVPFIPKDADVRVFAIARSAEKFCKDFWVKPIASELLVASDKYKFAGTLDSLMMVGDVTNKGDLNCTHELWSLSQSKQKEGCVHCDFEVHYKFTLVDWKTSNSIWKAEYAMQVAAYRKALHEMTGLRTQEVLIVQLDKKIMKYTVGRLVDYVGAFKAFHQVSQVYDWLLEKDNKLVLLREKIKLTL